jgi:hypothetical protein
MNSVNRRVTIVVALLIGGQAGCRTDVISSLDPDGLLVEAVTPTRMFGTVGGSASPVPSIRVTTESHKPVPNIPVHFIGGNNASYATNAYVVTDLNGIASPGEWRFGTRPVDAYLSVIVNGRAELSFIATLRPDVPAELFSSSKEQVAFPGETVAGPSVLVRDRFANPVKGISVEFEVVGGSGRLERSSSTSDRDGVAYAGPWVLGPELGDNLATARVPGLDIVSFSARVVDPATLTWYRADSMTVGTHSFTPIENGVTDARLGMTPFDPCLCKKQVGYFIDQQTYIWNGGQVSLNSGSYVLDGSTLSLSNWTTAGTVDRGRLSIERPDPEWGFPVTWIYKEISSTPP